MHNKHISTFINVGVYVYMDVYACVSIHISKIWHIIVILHLSIYRTYVMWMYISTYINAGADVYTCVCIIHIFKIRHIIVALHLSDICYVDVYVIYVWHTFSICPFVYKHMHMFTCMDGSKE